MSQEALADNAEIHRTQMTGIEWGERLPRIDTLIKLAGGLGISPCELLDGIVSQRFGENLRRGRRREGLSQEQLAMPASLHRTEVGRLEAGERVCRIDTLIRLAGAMAIPPGELLDGIDWAPGPETSGTFVAGAWPRRRDR
jgi:transcriptional regulator with XRE-family HTH domain